MHERILSLVNLLLVLLCGGFLYYLVTAQYEEPPEIREARRLIEEETTYSPVSGETLTDVRPQAPINAGAFKPLYTPPPPPPPTPTPTPPPPNLPQGVSGWKLQSIDPRGGSATFINQRVQPNERIVLKIGGAPYSGEGSQDGTGRPVIVRLNRIEGMPDPGAELATPDGQLLMMRIRAQ